MPSKRRSRHAGPHGVLVVDKPTGLSSHSVVGKVRKALGTRRVGHAGTLDPLATGVLVVMVGEATKLSGYLTLHNKCYEAKVALGTSTDTLDAEGTITDSQPLPDWLGQQSLAQQHIEGALNAERLRKTQVPPAYSAIKVDGQPGYKRARSGEHVELPERPVAVRALSCTNIERGCLDLQLDVSKGYYVRSLARDVGQHLRLPAHLAALRRTASGPFHIGEAIDLDAVSPEGLMSIEQTARRVMNVVPLTEEGSARARMGKRMSETDFGDVVPVGLSAWMSPQGKLIALGESSEGQLRVRRGFRHDEPDSPS